MATSDESDDTAETSIVTPGLPASSFSVDTTSPESQQNQGPHGINFALALGQRQSPEIALVQKMNPEHVSTFLNNTDKEDKRKWIAGIVDSSQTTFIITCVLILVGLLSYWAIQKEQYDVMKQIVMSAITFAGGFGARGMLPKKKKDDE